MLTAQELRQKYLDFFSSHGGSASGGQSKGHIIIPSASLVPENDPTVLFTTAGMHPLVPYLIGETHPAGKRIANIQKCIRTIDINEVGDATHHTFFEMLGNWSLGDYFKEKAIKMSWEFLTDEKWLGLSKGRIAVSVFAGDDDAPFDEESYNLWKNIGVPEKRIAKLPKKNNWWGPAGETGPCGADTEIFYWAGDENKIPDRFNDDNDLWVEIWNNVFMEYNKKKQDARNNNQTGYVYEKLAQKNVDTGMGMERILAAINGYDDNYRTELFWPIIDKIEKISGKKYDESEEIEKSMRIIADHIKAAIFIIADGIVPSNVQRGYVLRRLIRRAIRQGHLLNIKNNFTIEIAKVAQEIYKKPYPEILGENVLNVLEDEENKFRKTLELGIKRFNKLIENPEENFWIKKDKIAPAYPNDGIVDMIFDLYQTYGFPLELVFEELKNNKINIDKNKLEEKFNDKLKQHQNLSRTASAGMFKGGLADASEITTKYHTATHLLLAALREILGDEIYQKGSNINAERLRFDFNYPEKLTAEQLKKIEDLVNQKIQEKIPVETMEMSKDEALKIAKISFDPAKYGDSVKVYKIGDFSIELCGGPHVKNTGEIGKFKIKKEESSSAGIRRIKAILE